MFITFFEEKLGPLLRINDAFEIGFDCALAPRPLFTRPFKGAGAVMGLSRVGRRDLGAPDTGGRL